MNKLKKQLGEVYTPKDLAQYLGVDEVTVRKYYQQLGGMRLGRRVLFFEKRIERQVLHGDFSEEEKEVAGVHQEKRDQKTETVSDKAGSLGMGSGDEEISGKTLRTRDKYNLLT